jgi:ArsR family metal-binding transcriptional regulator
MITSSQKNLKLKKLQIFDNRNCQEDNHTLGLNSSGSETLLPLLQAKGIEAVVKCLSQRSLLRLKGNHAGEILSSEKGVLWITQTGDPTDQYLNERESLVIKGKGDLLIQAMNSAQLKISRPHETGETNTTLGKLFRQVTARWVNQFLHSINKEEPG